MSGSTYKGDSPGKKVTRLRVWLNIRAICRALSIPYTGTLVLAGEGGDLSVLKAMGTDLSTVVAVDEDPFLIEWCGELYPEVLNIVGEAGEMSTVADYNISHLDFCGGLRKPDNIVTFARIAQNAISQPSLIALTMQKCREGASAIGSNRLLRAIPRDVQRLMLEEARKRQDPMGEHIFRGNNFDSVLAKKICESRFRSILPHTPSSVERGFYRSRGALGNLGHAVIRADAVRWAAEWLITAWNFQKNVEPLVIRLIGTYTYHSNNKRGGGQPYLTALFVVVPQTQQSIVMEALQKVEVQRFDCWDKHTSMTGLKPTAMELLKHLKVERVSQLLDFDAIRTLESWKEEDSVVSPLFSVENLIQFPWRGLAYKKRG